jgi:hypothetical protein
MKEKIEIIEKLLIVMAMIVGIITSAYTGGEYLSAQSSVVNAKAMQELEIAITQQLLTKTYSDLLRILDEDIRKLDKKLENESYDDIVGWKKLFLIRKQKNSDRNQLLTSLSGQVVSIRNAVENESIKR